LIGATPGYIKKSAIAGCGGLARFDADSNVNAAGFQAADDPIR